MLDRLGVLKAVDAGAAAIHGMRITAPDGTAVTGHYRDVGAWRPYRQHAMGVAREILDGALIERVRALPLDLREQTRVVDLADRATVRSAGSASRIATRASTICTRDWWWAPTAAPRWSPSGSAAAGSHALRRMALVTYVAGLESCRDLGEIFVDPPDYAILNPIAPDRANLALVVPLEHGARWSDRLDDFMAARVRQLPHLARRLAGATRVAPIRALGPLAHRVEPPRADGVLLVGDAGGFYDPFTGEGVFTALRSAELAVATIVRALRSGDVSARALAGYERARREVFSGKERVTQALQFLIRHRRLANFAVSRAGPARPAALDALLGVFGDYVPPRALPAALRG